MNRLFPICLAFLTICAGASAQENSAPVSPEMAQLAKALAGDWDTTETMVRSEFFPNGGARRGHSHVVLTAGGRALINEVHSDGSAGKLDGIVIVWWEKTAGVYHFLRASMTASSLAEFAGPRTGTVTRL